MKRKTSAKPGDLITIRKSTLRTLVLIIVLATLAAGYIKLSRAADAEDFSPTILRGCKLPEKEGEATLFIKIFGHNLCYRYV